MTLACVLMLSACVGMLPGGSDAENKSLYDKNTEIMEWIDSLEPGMGKGEVFARLGRVQKDFQRLTRSEVVGVLFGGKDAGIPEHFQASEDIMAFLESLEGYRMNYKDVRRKHGFSSPIRVQTDAKGVEYSLSLVFKNGVLFQKPYVTGGVVNETSSRTIFDFFNPGLLIDAVK